MIQVGIDLESDSAAVAGTLVGLFHGG